MRMSRALVTTTVSAGALALSAVMAPAAVASGSDHPENRPAGATTVVLDPELVPVLVDTLHVTPVPPARLSAPEGVAQVSFPITEVERKEIEHSGGLRFTPVGGGSLRITEFEIDLRTGFLDAETRLNGTKLGDVDIFQLGEVQPIDATVPPCAGTEAGLTLTPEAATALGDPSFAGAFVGNACVLPKH